MIYPITPKVPPRHGTCLGGPVGGDLRRYWSSSGVAGYWIWALGLVWVSVFDLMPWGLDLRCWRAWHALLAPVFEACSPKFL